MTKAKEIRGSRDFGTFFEPLGDTDPLKKEIRDAFQLLKNNCSVGDKIR